MKIDLHLPLEFASITARRLETVLVEYEEPEIVTLRDDFGALYLGVAIDEDEKSVRWLHSVLDLREYEAMVAGELSLRKALLKPKVWVVDHTRDGSLAHAWALESDKIPERALPKPEALLPRASRVHLRGLYAEAPTLHSKPQRRRTIPPLVASEKPMWA